MGLDLDYSEDQTPLDEDEKECLLISIITTRGELDEFEQLEVEKANEWLLSRKLDAKKILKIYNHDNDVLFFSCSFVISINISSREL